MDAMITRPPRNTGPIELRDFGPSGRRLGTEADCYDGSPWELHRGELVEQMGSKDIHAVVMALLAALFRNHARAGLTVMSDVYCDLTDAEGPSLRAPDVVLVKGLTSPRNEAYHGIPVLAVEIRGTQSKRYLEEKVKLYLEHDWPQVWIAHAERRQVEVLQPGTASITYRPGTDVPLPPELDKYGLRSVPVVAFFDDQAAERVIDGWVHAHGETRGAARGRAQTILEILAARGFAVPEELRARVLACTDMDVLAHLPTVAVTSTTLADFEAALRPHPSRT